MPVHFPVFNGVHVTVFYVQRIVKIISIKYRDGLISPLILLLLDFTEWYSPVT